MGWIRRRWRRLLVGTIVGAVVVAGGLVAAVAAGLLLHDTSTPSSVAEAVRLFRIAVPHPAGVEGVYLYRTSGEESVDALRGAHHTYPATTTITVARTACGLRLTWRALETRSDAWTICGGRIQQIDEVHTFFGSRDETIYVCHGSLACRSGRGRLTGTLVSKGGSLALRGRITGGDSGTETIVWRFGHGGVPERVTLESSTSRPLFIGRVRYRERAELRLSSATPRR